jgi:hypothetical protein
MQRRAGNDGPPLQQQGQVDVRTDHAPGSEGDQQQMSTFQRSRTRVRSVNGVSLARVVDPKRDG